MLVLNLIKTSGYEGCSRSPKIPAGLQRLAVVDGIIVCESDVYYSEIYNFTIASRREG